MRDMIDYSVAREIVELLRARFNDRPDRIAQGRAAATIAQVLIFIIQQEQDGLNMARLEKVCDLIADLALHGWDIPDEVEKTQ